MPALLESSFIVGALSAIFLLELLYASTCFPAAKRLSLPSQESNFIVLHAFSVNVGVRYHFSNMACRLSEKSFATLPFVLHVFTPVRMLDHGSLIRCCCTGTTAAGRLACFTIDDMIAFCNAIFATRFLNLSALPNGIHPFL
jgi:hypothetical protein